MKGINYFRVEGYLYEYIYSTSTATITIRQ